ncbi:hypothetical protein HAX54_038996 [Datura stramonium]|uniref:Uncharacterized protein n=1 Tax=Datura stramonium TaxID=4076 RepID=A0ABS8VPJ5_DATST|nr:hypothetical protein [Datura stramonium]
MQACHNNYQGVMGSIGSWGKKSLVRHANAATEDERSDEGATTTVDMYYLLSENSRALYRVGPGFREPFDDDDATNEEQAQVDSNLESNSDDGDDSEMGKATFAPHR